MNLYTTKDFSSWTAAKRANVTSVWYEVFFGFF